MQNIKNRWQGTARGFLALLCTGVLLAGFAPRLEAKSSSRSACCNYEEQLGEIDFCGSSQCSECFPGVGYMISKDARLNAIYKSLWPDIDYLTDLVKCSVCLTTCTSGNCYDQLLFWIQNYENDHPNSFIIIALADGTIVYNTLLGGYNSCSTFILRELGNNGNDNLPILQAQLSPCGLGAMKFFSCPLLSNNSCHDEYSACVAIRLGCYLHSVGTIMVCDNYTLPPTPTPPPVF